MAEQIAASQWESNSRNPFNYEKVEQVTRDQATAWLTLEEITQQLNLFGDESQDTYLTSLELAVRFAIEDFLGFAIFPTQYRVYYGSMGTYNQQVNLDLPEVSPGATGVTINNVSFWDQTPTLTTIASSNWFYDPTGNRVILNAVPSDISTQMANPLQVLYTVKANPIGQYPVIKQAGLLLLTHLYNNRSDSTTVKLKTIPFGVEVLLRPYKTLVM
jgi:hypothetical protein